MPKFWITYAAVLSCSLGLFIPFVHLVPYARDAGLSERVGVLLMGLIGVGSLVGRFGLAGYGDRIARPALHVVVYLGMALMLALWFISPTFGAAQVWALGLFAVAFGTFYGAFVALQPAMVMDYYGARNVSGIIGVLYTGAGIGNLLGPWLAGLAFDWQRSYSVPIIASISFMLMAAVLAQRLRREPIYQDAQKIV
jgi:MFS transporter, OFA family, oxalate/formate antiporter